MPAATVAQQRIKIAWIIIEMLQWIKTTFRLRKESLLGSAPVQKKPDRPWLDFCLAVSLLLELARLGFSPIKF